MGANAQTSVPTFTAGEILTAANMNISAGTGIPVFANSTTRDAAFGGTGEKTLAEGQFAYLESTNVTQYYDGATWQPISTTPGLVLIATASYTSATSFTISSCFTSTYTNYRLIFDSTGNNNACTAQLLVGATPTTTNYNYQTFEANSTSLTGARSSSQSQFYFGPLSDGGQIDCMIYRPQLTEKTGFISTGLFGYSFVITSPVIALSSGLQNSSTAFDGITVTGSASALTGRYFLYGMSKV